MDSSRIIGRFVWHDILTDDPGRTKAFYTELFGWKTREMQVGNLPNYTAFRCGETEIGGMMPMPESMHLTPHWVCYGSVDNVDAAVSRASALGATVVLPPEDIPSIGRFALLRDPHGATLAPFAFAGHEPLPEPSDLTGRFDWHQLNTPDLASAASFYREVLGWESQQSDGPMGKILRFSIEGRAVAGAVQTPLTNQPAHWLPYVRVQNIDTFTEAGRRLGGKIWVAPTDIPSLGQIAVIGDPSGALIGLLVPLESP